MKAKVARRPVPKPLTAEERRGLEDVDELLKMLIRENRRLHARLDRIARSITALGEPEIDKLLKALRKRLQAVPAARRTPVRRAVPRRRVHAA